MAPTQTRQARYAENMNGLGFKRVSVRLGEDTRNRLERLSKSAGVSKADVIASAIFMMEKGT